MVTISSFEPLYQYIIISLMIIGIIQILKRKGLFVSSDQAVFDRLVTELAVPAVIFSIFVTSDFSIETLVPAGILFVSLILCLCTAYGICLLLKLPPKITGTLVMVSGFGSTATMATPLISDMLNIQSGMVEQGVTIGTIGIALPFFTLGAFIASYFGSEKQATKNAILPILREFLLTPIFISFILGAGVALILNSSNLPGSDIFTDFFTHFFSIISLSIYLLIWISIGLMLKPMKIRSFLSLLALVVLIKLLLEPIITLVLAEYLGLQPMTFALLLLESAVPSGAIAAVLSSRYQCDGTLASWMIVGTYLISLVTIPVIFFLAPI